MKHIKHLLTTLALLLCTTLLSAQIKDAKAWQEVDTLIAQGHYTSAYEKSEKLFKEAKRKGDDHALLKAAYKGRVAAAAYQEEHLEGTIKTFQSIVPLLQGNDKSIACLLLSASIDDYKDRHLWRSRQAEVATTATTLTLDALCKTPINEIEQWGSERFAEAKRLCFEAALAESEALKATRTEDYDLLIEGDTLGLRLRPTLYDIVVHAITESLYLSGGEKVLVPHSASLMGTAEEFAHATLSHSTGLQMWQLAQLQALTQHHLHTADADVRAYLDLKRMECLRSFARNNALEENYVRGMERITESYCGHPTAQAMLLYQLAQHHEPQIYTHTDSTQASQEVAKALRMEHYMQRIEAIAPDSEWNTLAKALYKSNTHPYLALQEHATLLPGREHTIGLTVRNAGSIAYRVVTRNAGENNENFVYKEVIRRRSVGKSSYKITPEMPNPYVYQEIPLTLPSLAPGDYFVIATNNGQTPDTKRSSITAISVTNLKLVMLRNEAEAEYLGMVLDATTGKAVTPCELTLMEGSGMQTTFIASYTPDAKGHFAIPLPEGRYRNLYLRAWDGASYTTYSFRYNDFAEHRYWQRSEEQDIETLFTFLPDRYTYKPGDRVQFSLIAYGHGTAGSSIKPHLPVKVSLTDTRNKEQASLQGTTDEWGCLNGTFILPEGATPGRFRINATDTESGRLMYHTINVEAFKAPTFKATMERPTAALHFGDSLTLKGTATTYTGLPAAGAKVRYEVTASATTIFGYHPIGTSRHITDTTLTDKEGYFAIPLRIDTLDTPNENATCHYSIVAHVTDLNGETQSTQTSFFVGQRTKHITFTRNGNMLMQDDSIGYSLSTLGGQRLGEEVILRLSRLAVPHHAGIRSTEESDMEQWSEERTLVERRKHTSADKESHLTLTGIPCGAYRLTITYTDGGKEYSETQHFMLWGEGKHTVSSYALYTTAFKARSVATGDEAVLHVGTRHSNVHVHYYVKVEDHVVDKGTLHLTDETSALRIPIKEGWRGWMTIDLVAIKEGVKRISRKSIAIEDKSTLLNVHLATLRNPLEPGDTEQCTLSVSDYWGNPVQAALTLSIYDAALDTYGQNYWDIALAPQRMGKTIEMDENGQSAWDNNTYAHVPSPTQPRHYALPCDLSQKQIFYSMALPTTRGLAKNRAGLDTSESEAMVLNEVALQDEEVAVGAGDKETSHIHLRTALSHTALFLPTLHTDERGHASFSFTAPDLLTEWHIKGIAHTKDLKHGRMSANFITRKALMVQPNVPRFLYEGDACDFTAKVTNSSGEPMEVTVQLTLGPEAHTKVLHIDSHSSIAATFPITAPEGATALTYRITAQGTRYSDGELGTIAILPRRALVTETMALYTHGTEKREFIFDALRTNDSKTLEHKSLRLDIVSNPAWYAIEALPPLCQEENPSIEQLFHRYYATAMGTRLIDTHPEVEGYADFFRRDSLHTLQYSLLKRLSEAQRTDGGWAWMEGFDSDRYTTQLIIKGLGELEAMGCIGIAQNDTLYAMVKQGIAYLDKHYMEVYERSKQKPKTLGSYELHYLYTRSFFPEMPFTGVKDTAYRHYAKLLLKDKAKRGTLMQKALKMLTLARMAETGKARKVAEVVRQSSLSSDEMGIYWRDNTPGYSWDCNPIATQALLIEAFSELGQPADIIARMQQWLLKQKQTTRWSSSIATAQAVHALVMTSSDKQMLSTSHDIEVRVGGKVQGEVQSGHLGRIQQEWKAEDITPQLAKVSLERQTASPSWGAMTWQYYEEPDKVKASGTGLSLAITYYKVETSDKGEKLTRINADTPLTKGDRVRVRIKYTADRAMDYVELHLRRPAALEPVSTRSGYTYSRGGSYYRSIENTKTTFYFHHINKGTGSIDCDLWVNQSGNYSCGVSTLQCMYAPEFVATAKSLRLNVEE